MTNLMVFALVVALGVAALCILVIALASRSSRRRRHYYSASGDVWVVDVSKDSDGWLGAFEGGRSGGAGGGADWGDSDGGGCGGDGD